MFKILFYGICGLMIFLVLFCSCGKTQTADKLEVEGVVVGVEDPETGTITQVDTTKFKPGESVCIVLVNVSGFVKDEKGMNRFDMDIEVTDPSGKVAFTQKEVLGFKGWQNLKDNIATTPSVLLTIDSSYPKGTYTFEVTIYDKIGSGKATVSETFEVIESPAT